MHLQAEEVFHKIFLCLEDGSVFEGFSFGASNSVSGEVVFNTGMVGYPESFSDPSYKGQILVLTYPLIGNYGVPSSFGTELSNFYESTHIHISGLVVSDYSSFHYHWSASRGLSDLLVEEGVPGIQGIDTRALTKKLREKGTMRGVITNDPKNATFQTSEQSFVPKVSVTAPIEYGSGKKRIAVVDCGCKNTIVKSLLKRDVRVICVPWDFDATTLDVGGILFSNGPGDPTLCKKTIETARRVINLGVPTFGICLGHQILALAGGAKTFKLKFGHRGQNQPCLLEDSQRCFITSQNHGFAVDSLLPSGWKQWFTNLNDGTNEGMRHTTKPIMSVQFHPEAMPGPVDTGFLFDEFVSLIKE